MERGKEGREGGKGVNCTESKRKEKKNEISVMVTEKIVAYGMHLLCFSMRELCMGVLWFDGPGVSKIRSRPVRACPCPPCVLFSFMSKAVFEKHRTHAPFANHA